MKRVLQIFRDGKQNDRYLTTPLQDGEQGNVQTLAAMAAIVQHDREQPDLRAFVLRHIIGDVAGHDAAGEVQRIFEFARDRITYRKDPYGVERVADLWSTLYGLGDKPEGDCGIKSTFVATCCALLGHQPVFVVIKQRPDQAAFNHVYVIASVAGQPVVLDATPQDAVIGSEAASVSKFYYKIF